MTYNKLKVRQAFMFEPNGVVFVRVRGGFKRGCGGPLYNALVEGLPMTLVEVFLYGV